jgi:hypothetical protein
MPDDRPHPGQGCACGEKSDVEASIGRILGNLGFPGKQDLPDQFHFQVPAFEFVGTVYAGKPPADSAKDLVPRTALLAQTASWCSC